MFKRRDGGIKMEHKKKKGRIQVEGNESYKVVKFIEIYRK